jgi:hypothetical protein
MVHATVEYNLCCRAYRVVVDMEQEQGLQRRGSRLRDTVAPAHSSGVELVTDHLHRRSIHLLLRLDSYHLTRAEAL